MIGDLHCHTRLSDGSMSIDDLVFYAKRTGLDFVSITDHDTMDGVTRAAILGKRYGISVIPGVEISCMDYSRSRKVHMLCYFPDKPDRLLGMLSQILDARSKAGRSMIRSVMRYFPVTEEHISRYTSGSKSIYKSSIMMALMDLGYDVAVNGPLYDELFNDKNGKCFRELEFYPDVYDVLKAINDALGIAVMAHPFAFDSIDLLDELGKAGLIHGAELFHPGTDDSISMEVIAPICDKYGLIKTGGSDFHGYFRNAPCPIASRITTADNISALFALKNSSPSHSVRKSVRKDRSRESLTV